MGWAFGIDRRRTNGDQNIGYGVESICDKKGCKVKIDRGLAYVCGGDPYGGENGCGNYFCQKHRDCYFTDEGNGDMSPQLCSECGSLWEEKVLLVPDPQ